MLHSFMGNILAAERCCAGKDNLNGFAMQLLRDRGF